MPKDNHTNLISKPEIQFWLPIMLLVVSIASSFFFFGTRIALLEQQVQQTNQLIAEHLNESRSQAGSIQSLDTRITRLETLEGIKK